MSAPLRKFALGILLAAALVAMIRLGFLARAFYGRLLEAQVWPEGPPEKPRFVPAALDSAPTILLLGDSRIAEWPLPTGSPFRWINAGVDGLTSAQVHLRAGRLLEEYHPDAVVVEAGINDLKLLGLRPELSDALVSQTAGHLLATAGLAASHGAKVLLLETWPATRPDLLRRFVWNKAIDAAVESLNAKLRWPGPPAAGFQVTDLLTVARVAVAPGIYRDTLHFRPETYDRLTPSLVGELLQTPSNRRFAGCFAAMMWIGGPGKQGRALWELRRPLPISLGQAQAPGGQR